MARDRGRQEPRVIAGSGTISKVYFGLAAAGVTGAQAINAVNEMLAAGILFREKETPTNQGVED